MSNWTRRQALFGLASTPLLLRNLRLAPEKQPSHKQAKAKNLAGGAAFQWLNVIIHGMVTMEISPTDPEKGVILTFPEVGGDKPHYYLAGSLDQKKKPPSDSLFPIQPKTGYLLSGVNHGSKPTFTRTEGNFILDNSSSSYSVNRTDKRTFTLPWPGASVSVRRKCRADGKKYLDKAPSGDLNANIKKIATIHVFSYSLKNGGPVITGNGAPITWTPLGSVVSPSGYANLHIFAEPKVGVDSSHAIVAFAEMMKIISKDGKSLETQYTFADFGATTLGLCGNDPNVPGLDPLFDFKNLPEHQANSGGEVANCVRTILSA